MDANGLVLVQVKKTGDKEVSAVVSGPSWYQYDISPSSPWQVRMTWSRHPACGSVDLQAMFDEATLYLAEDNDDRVKDDDSRLNDPAFRDGDDVPTYMEFLVINVRQPSFPSAYSTIGGTIDFTQAAYCNVQDFNHLDNLLYADLANVKLVDKILIDGIHYAGRAYPGVPGIVLAKQCNLGGTSMPLDWLTVIHEYGHSAGLEHRGWVIPPPTGHQPNPGDWEDTTAVMHYQHAGGKEVNRFEQTKFTTWNPALWNPPPAP